MIQELVKRWDAKKADLRDKYSKKRPGSYGDIVKDVVQLVTSEGKYGDYNLDPERITLIDHGDYQGTELFIIPEKGYQPSRFWFVKVGYGSCSGCDTLQSIQGWSDQISQQELDGTMTLALHILQAIKPLDGESV